MTAVSTDAPAAKKPRTDDQVPAAQAMKGGQAVEIIENLEAEIDKIEDDQSEAIIKLEQEYIMKKIPLYEKRAESVKNIPDFWSKSLMSHPQLSCLVEECDEEPLAYLNEILVDQICKDEVVDGKKRSINFSIAFKFKENPFFSNQHITKTFYQQGEEVCSETNDILWKEGKNFLEKKKPENPPMAGDLPDLTETNESFFNWFIDHDDAQNDDTADAIKDDLYVRALSYYLNEDDSEEDDDEEISLKSEEAEE